MTLSNADKLRFAEVEDRITREFGDNDTMDFLEYLKQQDVENDLRQDSLEESIEFLVNECGELQKEVNEHRQQEETKLILNFKKLSPTAITPTKAHTTDAGFDLYADEDVVLKYGETAAIKTNIAIELPEGYVADVRPRSGLTLNTGLRVHYGTVDSGYRDGIGIICENGSHVQNDENNKNRIYKVASGTLHHASIWEQEVIIIKQGQKIAQLVILPIPEITLQEVNELSDSDRGVNGFGSTGA